MREAEGAARAAARSATKAAFNQYGKLQMLVLSRVVSVLVVAWLASFVLFAIIRLLTGVSIKRLGYFSLRHISFTPKPGVEIKIGKIGINLHRPTVAKQGYFTLTIANFHLEADPAKIIAHSVAEAEHDTAHGHGSSPASDPSHDGFHDAQEPPDSEDEPAVHDSAMRQGFPLVMPKMARWIPLMRWIVRHLKVFDVYFVGISLDIVGMVTVVTTQASVRLDVRASPNLRQANFVGTLDEYQMAKDEVPFAAKLQVVDCYIAESLDDENPHQLVENLVTDVSGVLNLTGFRLKDLAFVLATQRVSVPMQTIIGIIDKVKQHRVAEGGAHGPANTKEASVFSDKDRRRLVTVGFWSVHLIKRIEFNVSLGIVTQIPHRVSGLRFAARLKDISLDVSRMNPKSPGFKLLYEPGDAAHQAIFTFASLNIGVESGLVQEELLYVPLVTSVTRGNLYSKTLRYFQDNSAVRNESKLRSQWTVHSPTINITRHNLPMVLLFIDAIRHHSARPGSDDFSDDEFAEFPSAKPFKVQMPFQNLLPKTDILLSISEAAVRLEVEEVEDVKPSETLGGASATDEAAIFIWGCEHVNARVNSVHTESNGVDVYNVTAGADVTNSVLWYRSPSTPRFDIMSLESVSFKIRALTQPQLSVDIEGLVRGYHITAVRYELFHKIRQLYLYVTQSRAQRRKRSLARRQSLQTSEPRPDPPSPKPHEKKPHVNALRKLPAWLTSIKIENVDTSLSVASDQFRGQCGDLLGPKLAVERIELTYERDATKDDDSEDTKKSGDDAESSASSEYGEASESLDAQAKSDASGDGRRLTLRGTNFKIYKITTLFWKHGEEDDNLRRRSTVMEVPQFDVSVLTLPNLISNMNFTLPKLVLSLNINLVLAAMVIHEVADHALGNDLRKAARQKMDDAKKATTAHSARPAAPPLPNQFVEATSDGKYPARVLEEYSIAAALDNVRMKLDLPSNDEIMLEISRGKLCRKPFSDPVLESTALRLYSKHPFQPEAWCIIMSFVGVKVCAALGRPLRPGEDRFILDIRGVRINVPFRFKLYRIIDNGITLGKGLKTLIKQTRIGDTDLTLDPVALPKLPIVPRIHLRTKALILALEDDYFESDLSLIFRNLLLDAGSRRNKTRIIEKKIKDSLKIEYDRLQRSAAQSEAHPSGSSHDMHNFYSERSEAAKHAVIDAVNLMTENVKHPHLRHNGGEHDSVHTDSSDPNTRPGSPSRMHSQQSMRTASAQRTASGSSNSHVLKDIPGMVAGWKKRASEKVFSAGNLAHKLRVLLDTPFELASDDASSSGHLVHPWLEFWLDDRFKDLRNSTYITVDERDLDTASDLKSKAKSATRGAVPTYGANNPTAGANTKASAAKKTRDMRMSIEEVRPRMLKNFSDSWMRTIDASRLEQHNGATKTMETMVPEELDPVTCAEEMVVDYSQKPLLFSAAFRDLDLIIDKTTYDSDEKAHKFMHDIGKGLPMDTQFSIWIPLFIDLRAQGGLKIDLLDYPLPVLHFPGLSRNQDPAKTTALRLHGNLIITEELIRDKRNVRQLFVPLKVGLMRGNTAKRGVSVIEVHRTLAPIKTYTDLTFFVGSELPSRVTWCNAYKPGFHGVGAGFTNFSKPPLDLSPKLGFWDKIRLVLHARFHFHLPKSPLYLMLKSGRNPYSLLNEDAGFAFVWRNNVQVRINENDEPKKLIVVKSDNFETVVPDFAAWETDYLHRSPGRKAYPFRTDFEAMQKPLKLVFRFGDHTTWTLGMTFQKKAPNGERDAIFRPHYKVRLSMPQYVFIEQYETYDAYEGFRSDYIFLAVSVVSRNEEPLAEHNYKALVNKNSAHLTPQVLNHFKVWKSQFSGTTFPGIRTGSLYPEPTAATSGPPPRAPLTTFGAALSGAQYQIALSPLDLAFFHLLRDPGHLYSSHSRCTGLKMKADHFVFDWHTRREPTPGSKRWRMKSFLGEVDIQSVDFRVIETRFHAPQSAKKALRELDPSFVDTDSSSGPTGSGRSSTHASSTYGQFTPRHIDHDDWVNVNDYTDLDPYSGMLAGDRPSVKVHTFMYAPRFSYFRRTDDSERWIYDQPGPTARKFGAEVVHECLLSSHHAENIQSQLLAARQDEINERISDMEASLESLTSGGSSKAISAKVAQLTQLIAMAKSSHFTLDVEIMRCQKHLELEEKRKAKVKEVARKADAEAAKKHVKLKYSDRFGSNNIPQAPETTTEPDINVVAEATSQTATAAGAKRKHLAPEERWPHMPPEALQQEMFGPADLLLINPEPAEDQLDDAVNAAKKRMSEQPQRLQEVLEQTAKRDVEETGLIEDFVNRFVVHAVHVKWNDSVRNIIYRMQLALSEQKELSYNRTQKAVRYLEELIAKADAQANSNSGDSERSADGGSGGGGASPAAGEHAHNGRSSLDRHDELLESLARRDETTKVNVHTSEELEKRMHEFFAGLVKVSGNETIKRSHSVLLLTPRIQFLSEKNPNSVGMVTAQSIEAQIVDDFEGTSKVRFDDESTCIEKRTGVVLRNSNCFVLGEDDVDQAGFAGLCLEPYSLDENERDNNWPPWVSLDLCFRAAPLSNFLILEDANLALRLDKPNELHVSQVKKQLQQDRLQNHFHKSDDNLPQDYTQEDAMHENGTHKAFRALSRGSIGSHRSQERRQSKASVASENESTLRDMVQDTYEDGRKLDHYKHTGPNRGTKRVTIDAPRLSVKMDSVQAFTAFMIATDLISYKDPVVRDREKAIARVVFATDFSGDFSGSLAHVRHLQKDVRLAREYQQLLNLEAHRKTLAHHRSKAELQLERESQKATLELQVLMRAFKTGLRKAMNNDTERETRLSIMVGNIFLRALNKDGSPIVDLKMDQVRFSRIVSNDHLAINRANVGTIDGRNMLTNAVYPQIIRGYGSDGNHDDVFVQWTALEPVGGIPIFENVIVKVEPMFVQLEQRVVDILMEFAFPMRHKDEATSGSVTPSRSNMASDDSDGYGADSDGMTSEEDSDPDGAAIDSALRKKTGIRGRLGGLFKPHDQASVNEIAKMVDRASSYINILHFAITSTRLKVSYKGRAQRNLLDLQAVEVLIPDIVYRNKMWTKLDLVMRLKRDIVRILLKQATSILGNRFVRHRDVSESEKARAASLDWSHRERSSRSVELERDDDLTQLWSILFKPQHRVKEVVDSAAATPHHLLHHQQQQQQQSSPQPATQQQQQQQQQQQPQHHHHHLSLHHHKSNQALQRQPSQHRTSLELASLRNHSKPAPSTAQSSPRRGMFSHSRTPSNSEQTVSQPTVESPKESPKEFPREESEESGNPAPSTSHVSSSSHNGHSHGSLESHATPDSRESHEQQVHNGSRESHESQRHEHDETRPSPPTRTSTGSSRLHLFGRKNTDDAASGTQQQRKSSNSKLLQKIKRAL